MKKRKLKVATCSLAGCFGCHMSFLDMDERIVELIEKIEFDRSPFTDRKNIGNCDLGLVEGLNAVEVTLDDETPDVGNQGRHFVSPNLVAGRFDQVAQHPKASREFCGVVQSVKQDGV